MNRFYEKILEKLLEVQAMYIEKYGDSAHNFEALVVTKCINAVEEAEEEYNNGWIYCGDRLPEEPERTEDIEESIYIGRLSEYNVMLKGAEKATTLYYAGEGDWYDEVSQEYYTVLAWQELPEPCQLKGV